MASKLEEAEANSQKGGKRVVQKLEQKVICYENKANKKNAKNNAKF